MLEYASSHAATWPALDLCPGTSLGNYEPTLYVGDVDRNDTIHLSTINGPGCTSDQSNFTNQPSIMKKFEYKANEMLSPENAALIGCSGLGSFRGSFRARSVG